MAVTTSMAVSQLVRFLERPDLDTFEQVHHVLAPDAVSWHNSDRLEVPADSALRSLVEGPFEEARSTMHQVVEYDGGAVLRFAVTVRFSGSDATITLENCLLVALQGDQIVRMAEYVDPLVSTLG